MPSRVIRGEINASESLSQVSPEAELVFRALLLAVDDYGRADARPAALKAALFPMRDSFTAKRISSWIEELAALDDPPLRLYESGGRRYLWLPNWEKHRSAGRRASESRFPDPPRLSEEILGNPRNASEIRPSDEGRGTSSEGREEHSSSDAAEPASPPEDLSKHPLLRLISRYDGDVAEKVAFLADELPVIEAEAEATGKAITSVFTRFYRAYVNGPRKHREAGTLARLAEMRRTADARASPPPSAEALALVSTLTVR